MSWRAFHESVSVRDACQRGWPGGAAGFGLGAVSIGGRGTLRRARGGQGARPTCLGRTNKSNCLRQLWLDGRSASQISAQLGHGLTRNAVIGKVHRLGLAGRAKSPSSAASRAAPGPAPRVATRAEFRRRRARRGARRHRARAVARADARNAAGVSRGRRRADVAAGDDRRTQGSDVPLAAGDPDVRRSSATAARRRRASAPIAPITASSPTSRSQDRRRERERERRALAR